MTYAEAAAVLRARWNDGARDVVMSPELYEAYESGVATMLQYYGPERDRVRCAYCGRANALGNSCAGCGATSNALRKPEEFLWFKNMRVRKAS